MDHVPASCYAVKFHNGQPFTAADVKYTFDKVMDQNFGSPRRPNFTPINHMDVLDDATVDFVRRRGARC